MNEGTDPECFFFFCISPIIRILALACDLYYKKKTTMAPRVKDLIWMRNRLLFAVCAAVEQVLYVMREILHVTYKSVCQR
jgi:hypothetical protein